jgi:NTP pyrophosphatase (non-canonical NTP hydrolase)
MNSEAFLQDCKRTELSYIDLHKQIESNQHPETNNTDEFLRLSHLALGVVTEAGELADAIKKSYYGQKVDETNILEEIGDLLFYVILLADHYHFDLDEAQRKCAKKLWKRYGARFSQDKAEHRNLQVEREVLED